MDSPSSFSMLLYEIHSYLSDPAIYYSPVIFFMLLRARDNRVIYFNGGKLTILSMQFDEIDSFWTWDKVLRTLVSSLSIGGVFIRWVVPRKLV